jgi:hypothetical protein
VTFWRTSARAASGTHPPLRLLLCFISVRLPIFPPLLIRRAPKAMGVCLPLLLVRPASCCCFCLFSIGFAFFPLPDSLTGLVGPVCSRFAVFPFRAGLFSAALQLQQPVCLRQVFPLRGSPGILTLDLKRFLAPLSLSLSLSLCFPFPLAQPRLYSPGQSPARYNSLLPDFTNEPQFFEFAQLSLLPDRLRISLPSTTYFFFLVPEPSYLFLFRSLCMCLVAFSPFYSRVSIASL